MWAQSQEIMEKLGLVCMRMGANSVEEASPERGGTKHTRKRSRGERHLLPLGGRECTSLLILARFSEVCSSPLPTMHYEPTHLPFIMELPPTGADLNGYLFSCICNTHFL